MEELGKIAYDADREAADGISLVNGDDLPLWESRDPKIKKAWTAAANAVADAI